MKKIAINTTITNGKITGNRNLLSKAIQTFEGSKITITLERFRKKRSNNQNRFYYGVVIPLVQDGLKEATGEVRGADSIHYNILLPLFAPTRDITNKDTGEIFSERITSSEMTTTEFMTFIKEIQKWAAEFLGIDIPDPNSELQIEFN